MQQDQSLYRQAAWQALSMQKHGSAVLLPSNRMWAISALLLLWIVLVAIVLVRHSFTEKTTVLGYITSDSPSLAIQAKEPSGSVVKVLVENGQSVKRGQHLLTIERSGAFMLGDDGFSNQLSILAQHKALLLSNEQEQIIDFTQQKAFIGQQQNALRDENKAILRQIALVEERILLSNKQVDSVAALLKDALVSQETVNQAQQSTLSLQQQVLQLRQQLANNASTQARLNAQYASIQQQIKVRNTETQLKQLPIEQRSTELNANRSYTLVAPKDGIVSNLLVQVGDDISRFPVLLKLSDTQANLRISVAVPASAAGFISPQQSMRVRLDAFPHQKYGTIDASVSKVANTITLPNEASTHPIAIQQPVFIVEAKLAQDHILARGEAIALKEGMTLQADVVLSERSILEWLLSPLYSMRGSL